ncbi:DUF1549 domain-containing protein [Thalassoroseus pseudoceratinae]|uniref:DUF1549 domain-containing protein n=1 Tax=Thalassoroseus pseudoceratinae TaxID=2713176 RepID=UPI0014217289|nr:DUF1549 domain-containing protein [Thalassoroseus pseudoceratinae]
MPAVIKAGEPNSPDPLETAVEVDRLLNTEFERHGIEVAPLVSDEDFLRRVSFDLAGQLPTSREVTLFGLNPDIHKRTQVVDRLLESSEYSENWARYWRDVVFSRATNQRAIIGRGSFTDWMEAELAQNTPWDEIAREIITATGDVRENGATGLIFAQEATAEEVASEVSRIFLGIQIQCANCHDHPTDSWTREQFHELAAFFPRISLRPKRDGDRVVSYEVVGVTPQSDRRRAFFQENPERAFRFLDRNRDGKLQKSEVSRSPLGRNFDRLLSLVDTDKDKAINLEELKSFNPPMMPGRGSAEHFMPNLEDPVAQGEKIDPVFFVNTEAVRPGATDEIRRESLADSLTKSEKNPWLARAIVNRTWSELLGEGFYMPIDDIGPERSATHPEALEVLANGFVASGHDLHWLFKTITATDAYARQIRPETPANSAVPFASGRATRLRSDQLFTAVLQAVNASEPEGNTPRGGGGLYRRAQTPRDGFNELFSFDPSTPQADMTGDVPQALYLMNSPQVNRAIRATADTQLGRLLNRFDDDEDALAELYLMVLAREPSAKELRICQDYIADVNNRSEAYEDLLWSLLNSSEFLTRR